MQGGILRPTMGPLAPPKDQAVSAIQGGVAYWTDIECRLAPYFVCRAPPVGDGLSAGAAESGRAQEQLAIGRSERRHDALWLLAPAAPGAVGP
jgi:hypothetical protein